jgi:hypothetical protein
MKFPVPRLLLSAFLQLTIGCSVCGIATSAELQRPAAPPRKCEVRQAVWCIYQGAGEITDRLVEHQKYDRVWIVRGFFQPRAPLVVMEPNGCREGLADSATAIRFDSQFVWERKSWNKMTVQVKKDGTCDLDILLPKAQSDPTGEATSADCRCFIPAPLRRAKGPGCTSSLPAGIPNTAAGKNDDLNLYAYVGNDPLNRTDPSGLKCQGTGNDASCTFDEFRDKKGNVITREQATSGGNRLTKALKMDPASRVARQEAAMTAKYKGALAPQERGGSVTISGNKSLGVADHTVSGGRIVSAMQSTPLVSTDKSGPSSSVLAGTVKVGATGQVLRIEFYSNGAGASDFWPTLWS